MVVIRSISGTTKKTTDTKIAVAETSSKQTKMETTIKAKAGTTKIVEKKKNAEASETDSDSKPLFLLWTVMNDAFSLFMREHYPVKYYVENLKAMRMWEEGHGRWASLTDEERDHYVKLVEKREAERQAEARRKMGKDHSIE